MAKIKNLKIIFILMLIIFTFCFCACGQINSQIIYNDDNSVDEIVTINLNNKEIENAGYNVDEIKFYIKTKTKEITDRYIQSLNDKVVLDLLTAPVQETQKLNSYVNGISAINKEENGTLMLGIKFKSIEVYKYYYGIGDSSSKAEIEEHFFYNKVVFKGNTLYARHGGLYEVLKAEFEQDYPNLINNANSEVLYTYVADQRREHSDADYISKVNGKYYHTWIVDTNAPQGKEIVIYYNVANQGNCILVAIAGSLVVAGVLSFIGFLIVKHKKKNENNENEKVN